MTLLKNILLLVTLVQFNCLHSNAQQSKKFFRTDYSFLPKSEGFYKIHTIHRTWLDAKNRCALEGASLFYPENQVEADAVLTFMKRTQPFYWVYIGISDLLVKGVLETIDHRPVEEVYNVWGAGEPNDQDGQEGCVILRRDGTLNDDRCDKKYPFICKKALDSLEWDTDCDMPKRDYVYNQGRCYKFHLQPKNWTEAFTICSAEQSYLAVVNSQVEADYLVKLTEQTPKNGVTGDFLRGAVHLGFHNRYGDGWSSIKGTSLQDNGYSLWGNQQPDGGDSERCGSMFYNGHLNDVGCEKRCFFICEHDIASLSNAIDDRFNDLI